MKKMYNKPEMSVIKTIKLEPCDIIRTSGEVADAPNSITNLDTSVTNYKQLQNSDFSVFD